MIRRLYLFDDRRAREWHPFALTRPIGELYFGALLLRERIERAIGLATAGYLATTGLEGFQEDGIPAVVEASDLSQAEDRILLSTRYVPPISEGGGAAPSVRLPADIPTGGLRLRAGKDIVGWLLPADHPLPPAAHLLDVADGDSGEGATRLPEVELPGDVLDHPWQVVSENPRQLSHDLRQLYPDGGGPDVRPLPDQPGVHRVGELPVSAGHDVSVDPGVVLDTRDGPIHLGHGVSVRPFTHLRGPAFIGRESVLLGGSFHALTCGPVCKLRGEVDSSVIVGYSNKAHDGYLGLSLIGRWVNMGAFTTNSDLKNNYGTIRVHHGSEAVDTGLLKLGVFLGDHVKTGIGTLLNGGVVVGAGANIFGGGVHSGFIPPFGWGPPGSYDVYRLDPFLTAAERAMARRGVPLTPGHQTFLARAWHSVHGSE